MSEKTNSTIVGGGAWNDKNGNGIIDAGEIGSPLIDATPIKTSLSSIMQTVRLGLDRTVGATDMGQYAPTWYSTSIGNRVWLDADGNGVQDENESGMAGVKVRLYLGFGQMVKETTTDAQGNYRFDNLGVGMYSVQFVAPDGYQFTKANATLDWFDSDADINGNTGMQFLFPGQYNQNVDAGLIAKSPAKASIGDKVWHDLNRNGQQDIGEPGLGNVDVILNRTDIVYIQAPPEIRLKTDVNGNYKFDNLEPGKYSLTFVKPDGCIFTSANVGNDNSDSDANPDSGVTAEFQLLAGQQINSIDAGLIKLPTQGTIGDRVWLDSNGNGIQDANEQGVAGVDVILNRTDIVYVQAPPEVRTKTDVNGYYKFDKLEPGRYSVVFVKPSGYDFTNADVGNDSFDSDANSSNGVTAEYTLNAAQVISSVDAGLIAKSSNKASIGDRVWHDANANGLQDSGEAGISNVLIGLYNQSGSLIKTTNSAADGSYLFDQLEAGWYRVGFSSLTSYSFTSKDNGSDALDSDADRTSGLADWVNLAAGERNNQIDAGYVSNVPNNNRASVGDKVWNDLNKNGQQDANEQGIAGVKVHLYNAFSWMIAETTTDSNGNYSFDNLSPGNYKLHVECPTGYMATQANVGNDATDSDFASDGMVSVTLASGDANRSIDAGFVADGGIRLKSSIGNRVWLDSNQNGIQDTGEKGVAGLNVYLYSKQASGMLNNPIATTKTDANGNYGFYDLMPGSYRVRSELPFPLYQYTGQNKGTDDTLDSDADGSGFTPYYDLVGGDNLEHVDIGMSSMFVFPPVGTTPTTTLPAIGDILFNNNGFENLLSNAIVKTIYGSTSTVTSPTLNVSNLFDQTFVPY